MFAAVFDLETNGLLDEVTKVHCLVIRDLQTGAVYRFRGNEASAGLEALDSYDILIAHNGIKFDLPVLKKLYGWVPRSGAQIIDTMVLARLLWPDLWETDAKLVAAGKLPGNLTNSHSLAAWGHRLGCFKGDYDGGWEEWNQEMEDYCVQDTLVTQRLYEACQRQQPDPRAVTLEMQVAAIVARQERHGFCFDLKAAAVLYQRLVERRLKLEEDLRGVFSAMYLPDGKEFTPKRDNKREGYVAGAPMTKVNLTMFNPGSRAHIARWLQLKRGWVPREHTDNGQPKIDEQAIGALKYPEAKLLAEYLMVEKRIGQLAEGKEAWMKAVKEDGRIHGSVNTIGAVTGRMTHSRPNITQVPANYSPYGKDCRSLFGAPPGRLLVGADAAALELRDLAGYMAAYDKGEYIKVVLEGDKAAGTDIHSVNARALGLDPKGAYHAGSGRDLAKTWFYAFIYGAGDAKLGAILTGKKNARAKGTASRAAFMANLPALGKLVAAVKKVAKTRGYLIGLDGRKLHVRSEHAALNTLLQSAGAVQMKKATCIADESLQEAGLIPGEDYEFVAHVHDEVQVEVKPEHADFVGRTYVEAIKAAGEHFAFACPLDGEYRVGDTWASTH